jgi:hypothetical protein
MAQTVRFSRRWVLAFFLSIPCVIALGSILLLIAPEIEPVRQPIGEPAGAQGMTKIIKKKSSLVLSETLTGSLGAAWQLWHSGPAKKRTAEVSGRGLQLGLQTQGCAAGEYLVGLRNSTTLTVGSGLRLAVELDWNQPENASFRAAGLLVAGGRFDGPFGGQAPAAFVEIVGIPPGQTARLYAAERTVHRERPLFLDGWPRNRKGRIVGRIRLEIEVRPDSVIFRAGGRKLAHSNLKLGKQIKLFLFLRSATNYPERPVFFEALSVEGLD